MSKTVALSTAGTLSSTLSVDELNTVTNLTITGNIDARDFRTMRDLMPMLAEIDLSGASIVAYSGTEGTSFLGNNNYSANAVPEFAFSKDYSTGKVSLLSMKLPSTSKSIGNYSFSRCYNLAFVSLPSELTSIGDYSFGACLKLTSIQLPRTLVSIGSHAFESAAITSIVIPGSVTAIAPGAFTHCNNLPSIDVDPANINFKSIEGILYNFSGTSLVQYPSANAATSYVIPSTVTTIYNSAFWDCQNLQSLTIPNSITSIENTAFIGCTGLTVIELPSSITFIGSGAFEFCKNLSSVKVNWSIPLNISNSPNVFLINNSLTRTLMVPYGTKTLYAEAEQWKDFQNIVEMEPVALTYVPDDNFEQALIDLGYDSGALDDYVPTTKISSVVMLNLANKNIADLTGIESFLKLEKLYLAGNKLTALDIRKNTLLKVLHCQTNQLTSLDLTENIALTELALNYNKLTSLDLSKNTALVKVFCQSNQITTLDVSNNSSLITLVCGMNQQNRLDISKNTALAFLACDNNKITSLDVSNNRALVYLDCHSNELSELNIKNGNNSNMIGQYKGMNAMYNQNLSCIEVDDPALSATYNWQKDASASYSADCRPKTYVPNDNFEQALINLGFDSGTPDDYVPTANIASVTSLDVSGKDIGDLTGIQDFVSLQQLNCASNNLTTIDVSKNVDLQSLTFYLNQLTSLDVSHNSKLQQIYGNYNSITNLDLSKNTLLLTLDFGGNNLTSLDLSQNSLLTLLNCSNNQISNIDLTNNINLEQIAVGGNPISTLDISRNLKLRWFYAQSTMLDKIDCSDHKALESIDCSRNSRLSALNLKNGNNSILGKVFAIDNPLLSCIQVDDPSSASTNVDWKKDTQAGYSSNCAIPVANAGNDQKVNEGTLVTLDGTFSFDSYGDPLAYTWTAPAGIILNLENQAKPSFIAPDVSRERNYTFSLMVNDGTDNSLVDAVIVTVKPINLAPNVICNNLTIKLDASGNYALSPNDLKSLAEGTTDDNDSFRNLNIVAEPSLFSCKDLMAPVQVKVTVSDSDGASSFGYSSVSASDVTPPMFSSVPKTYNMVILSGESYLLPDFSELYPAKEVCSKVSYTQIPAPGTSYANSTKETIALKAIDEFGNNAQVNISFTLTVRSKLKSADISVPNEICDLLQIEVYPNPVSGPLTIDFGQGDVDEAQVSVFNIQGGLILQQELSGPIQTIDMAGFVPGSYLVKVKSGESTLSKIIIKK